MRTANVLKGPHVSSAATVTTASPKETFEFGERLGGELKGGELILLIGELGAGKTLLTKGILCSLDFDPHEVTSPSFALVNLYHARYEVYHLDLWRLDRSTDAAVAVGLDDILEDERAIVIVEWAEKLRRTDFRSKTIEIRIKGDGDLPRQIEIAHRHGSE